MSDVPPKPADKKPQALHRLAKPQPKPPKTPAQAETGAGSGSATGFVSMLARKQFDVPDTLEAAARRSKDQLRMAREIQPVPPQAAPPTVTVPRWYGTAVAVSLVLAASLIVIGAWAVGALIYMHKVAPLSARQVHYPLIAWSLDVGTMGGYTPASRMMAWSMLMCLPVALLLVIMAIMLRRRIAVTKQNP